MTMRRFLIVVFLAATAVPGRAYDELQLDVAPNCKEWVWRNALAAVTNGLVESASAVGRIDVATSNEVFELDWAGKWQEGLGQVLTFGVETGKQPVLALIVVEQLQRTDLALVEKHCARHGIRLLILRPARKT